MNSTTDWKKEEAASDVDKLVPGGYVCRIVYAQDIPKKEMLEVHFEIAEGNYTNYFSDTAKRFNRMSKKNILYRPYREDCKRYFKLFLNHLEASNPGFDYKNDESIMAGKFVGIIFGEEEFLADDGTVKVSVKAVKTCPVDDIRSGNFKIPQLKKLPASKKPVSSSQYTAVKDEDLPF